MSEIILRRESYGGTVFHPLDATFVQLDHEAFECAARVLGRGERAHGKAERALIKELMAALPRQELPVRVVSHDSPRTRSLPSVLSAPTLVDFQITERCGMGCPQCYASSLPKGRDASWEDMVLSVKQMREAGVCQIAIGGGEPILHPRLEDFFVLIRENGMVPNITTTGVGMSERLLLAMKRHCGAVAMSLEGVDERFAIRRKQGFANFKRTAQRFLDAGVPLVMQITVSSGNLEDLASLVEFCSSLPLYGVVFLAHKPSGRAVNYDQPLAHVDHASVHEKVLEAVHALRPHTRVGFDCCFTPAMVGFERDLGFNGGTIVEGCSATRSGIGLTPGLDVLPCTFLGAKKLGNLRERTLLQIWQDSAAMAFRSAMETHSRADSRCRGCSANASCLGGCSAWSLTSCVTKSGA